MDIIGRVHHIRWWLFGGATLSLPLLGLLFCVIYSILYNFAEANATHCNVWNVLPSISAAAGSREPQISLWKLSIIVHAPFRYIICLVYMLYYNAVARGQWRLNCYPFTLALAVLNFTEITCLCLLTLVGSNTNFAIHKLSFILFLITSLLYMIIHSQVQSSLIHEVTITSLQQNAYSLSLKRKYWSMLVNMVSLVCAGYMYYRHNKYCEPGVYSLFALSEYLVVLSNMAYHSTAILDFSVPPPVVSITAYHKLSQDPA